MQLPAFMQWAVETMFPTIKETNERVKALVDAEQRLATIGGERDAANLRADGLQTQLATLQGQLKAEQDAHAATKTSVDKLASEKAANIAASQGVPANRQVPTASNTAKPALSRKEFEALGTAERAAHIRGGGKVTDAA